MLVWWFFFCNPRCNSSVGKMTGHMACLQGQPCRAAGRAETCFSGSGHPYPTRTPRPAASSITSGSRDGTGGIQGHASFLALCDAGLRGKQVHDLISYFEQAAGYYSTACWSLQGSHHEHGPLYSPVLIQCLKRSAERHGKVTEFVNLRTSDEVRGSLCTDPSLGSWINVISQSFLQHGFPQQSLGEVISQSFYLFHQFHLGKWRGSILGSQTRLNASCAQL